MPPKLNTIAQLLANIDGSISTTKSITIFGVVVGALVLLYATYKQSPDLYLLYGIFMGVTGGLTVSKGVFNKPLPLNKEDDS